MDPRLPVALVLLLGPAACEPSPPDLVLPDASEVEAYYETERRLEAEVSGNVVEVRVDQPAEHLRRGGTLWAKVGPYVFVFTEATRGLFEDYPGLAAVRVVTRLPDGSEVARAMLVRDELSDVQWRRALNIAGKARGEGPLGRLDELVRWGEEHTTFEYNPTYASVR